MAILNLYLIVKKIFRICENCQIFVVYHFSQIYPKPNYFFKVTINA